jgi:hypothetical protein
MFTRNCKQSADSDEDGDRVAITDAFDGMGRSIDGRALAIGEPQTNKGRCGNQPAKINRHLKPHRQPCAALPEATD